MTVPGRTIAGTDSVYETWVSTLRAWAQDPRVSLDQLPPLTEEDFTPATYSRLVVHIAGALQTVTQAWIDALQRTMGALNNDHDLAREMVQLRDLLARRLQLAGHPSLPAALRDPLMAETRRAIEEYQKTIERDIDALGHDNLALREASQRFLRVVREAPFTAVLRADFSLTSTLPSSVSGEPARRVVAEAPTSTLTSPPRGAQPDVPTRFRRVQLAPATVDDQP